MGPGLTRLYALLTSRIRATTLEATISTSRGHRLSWARDGSHLIEQLAGRLGVSLDEQQRGGVEQ